MGRNRNDQRFMIRLPGDWLKKIDALATKKSRSVRPGPPSRRSDFTRQLIAEGLRRRGVDVGGVDET